MKLSDSQRKFCQLVVDGVSHTESYLQAYDSCKSQNATGASATRMMLRNAKVQEEIEKLRAKMETLGGLSRLKVREILCKIVMDPTSRGSDVIRAIVEDNKMMGRYKQKEEHKTDPWADLLRG